MAKKWQKEDFDMTQAEVADETGMSQQNVNDAQCNALRKAKEGFLKIYTLDEIRSYIRYCEGR